jgi:replication factor C subunit 1
MDKQAKSGNPVKNTSRKRQLSTSSNDSESRKSSKKPKLEPPPKPAKKQPAQKQEKRVPKDTSKQSKHFPSKSPAPAKPVPKSKASPSPNKFEQSNVTKRKSMVQDFKSQEKKAGHVSSKTAQPKSSDDAGLPLAGQTFVLSGVIENYTRDELTDLLKSFGARVTGSVSSKTSCLIHGEVLEDGRPYTEGAKYKKAVELGKKLMDKNDLNDMIDRLKVITGSKASPSSEQEETADENIHGVAKPVEDGNLLWTSKYAPVNLDEVIGNNQAVKKLQEWLEDWESVVLRGNKKEVKLVKGYKFDPTANENARAALLSGAPGIGKTTAARLVAKGLGYQVYEMNASDVRSRKAILEPIKAINNNTALAVSDEHAGNIVKTLIIFDEIDGMSSGDRGGTGAFIEVIKNTKVPIICICNDRQSPKVRNLANSCYDIRFHKPNKQSISNRVKQILNAEGMKVQPNAIDHLIEVSGSDIRQVITALEMWAKYSSEMSYMQAKQSTMSTGKDAHIMINSFEAASKLLRKSDQKSLTQKEKMDLFFIDYDLVPLLIHENYLQAFGSNDKEAVFRMADAADSIAFSDVLNKKVRIEGEWSLLQHYGQASSIEPGSLAGYGVPFPRFPEFLGRFSTQRKNARLLQETRYAMEKYISGDDEALLKDYIPIIYRMIMTALQNDQVEEAVELMHELNITPDILKEHLVQLQPGAMKLEQDFKDLPAKLKSSLTRIYNAHYKSSLAKVKKARGEKVETDYFDPEFEDKPIVVEEEEEEEILTEVKPIEKPARKPASKRGRKK